VCLCVFITALSFKKLFACGTYYNFTVVVVCVYYCSTYYKAVREGGGGVSGGHVLRETTSRGLCELVCPSRTSEQGVECVVAQCCCFITAVPNTMLCAWGEEDSGGLVL
jgi:hypothetical protein